MMLFDFQKQGVKDILKTFETEKAACLAWYTGAGKTNTFIEIARQFLRDNPEAKVGISAFITTEIKDQIFERLGDMGGNQDAHKVSYRSVINKDKSIYVFNPQGIYFKKPDLFFDLFIIDEGHIGLIEGSKMLKSIMATNCHKNTKILIVSATPWDTLMTKRFKDIPVLKRTMDQGLLDGTITDVKFYAEEANVEFALEDFTRKGDLSKTISEKKTRLLKSACLGKMKNIVSRYDKELGDKVLVICPPGNMAEVARGLAKEFKGLAYIEVDNSHTREFDVENTSENLETFKKDKAIRFLFVVYKCTIGFDMQELDSVIDLTMTRNITNLCQRFGRVARKHGNKVKRYFYVYDKSLLKDKLQWLLMTMVDFCLGHYDGWNTKTVKYKKQTIFHGFAMKDGIYLSEIINMIKNKNAITNKKEMAFVSYTKPTIWDLEKAKKKAQEYQDRTDMWANNPGLYKWFRLNAKTEMDIIFPLKHRGCAPRWNEKTVIAAMKECKIRKDFYDNFGGADDWVQRHKRKDLIEKYLPPSRINKYIDESIIELLKKTKKWSDLRSTGFRSKLIQQGTYAKWRAVWEEMHGKKVSRGRSVIPVNKERLNKIMAARQAMKKKRVSA